MDPGSPVLGEDDGDETCGEQMADGNETRGVQMIDGNETRGARVDDGDETCGEQVDDGDEPCCAHPDAPMHWPHLWNELMRCVRPSPRAISWWMCVRSIAWYIRHRAQLTLLWPAVLLDMLDASPAAAVIAVAPLHAAVRAIVAADAAPLKTAEFAWDGRVLTGPAFSLPRLVDIAVGTMACTDVAVNARFVELYVA